MGDSAGRIAAVRAELDGLGLDGLLVTDERNRRYLSGFTGTAGWLLVTGEESILLTDSRYWEQAEMEAPDWTLEKVTLERGSTPGVLKELLTGLARCRNLGIESDSVSFTLWQNLNEALGFCAFSAVRGLVEALRLIKDAEEAACLREAARRALEGFRAFRPLVRPGMAQSELAAELDCALRRAGLAPGGFETICASGPSASRPHARSTQTRVEEGELLLVDFGGTWQGYHCDVTRTFPVGTVSDRHASLYRIVEEAHRRALAAARPGMICRELDGVARAFIAEAGYADCFGHSLGHGLGLSVHEAPAIKRGSEQPLEAGMVFTVEPGIYLPGFAGVRIEDMVMMGGDGVEPLTEVAYEAFDG